MVDSLAHADVKTQIYTPTKKKEAIILTYSQEDGTIFRLHGSETVPILSPSVHYAISGFEGAKVVVHETKDGRRLYLLHYDWNVSRLNSQVKFWGLGELGMSDEQHMTAVANLLYANGWDQNPILKLLKDGLGKETNQFYVRPLLLQPDAENITLRATERFGLALIVLPSGNYHGDATDNGLMVLNVPEPRRLQAPQYKLSENYPYSERWSKTGVDNFKEWIASERPEIIWDGEKLSGSKRDERAQTIINRLNEVLCHNDDGVITEGSAENVAIISGGVFKTPPIEAGALPGFTMQKAEIIAGKVGLTPIRQPFGLEELLQSEAMMTGNAAGAVPVCWVVECKWDIGEDFIYRPRGPIKVTTVKKSIDGYHYQKIKKELDLILAGKSELGKFGIYADELLSGKDIARIREMTQDLVRSMDKKMRAELVGKAPADFRSTLADGKQLRYAKLLNIK